MQLMHAGCCTRRYGQATPQEQTAALEQLLQRFSTQVVNVPQVTTLLLLSCLVYGSNRQCCADCRLMHTCMLLLVDQLNVARMPTYTLITADTPVTDSVTRTRKQSLRAMSGPARIWLSLDKCNCMWPACQVTVSSHKSPDGQPVQFIDM
jgi:hypothetical protein